MNIYDKIRELLEENQTDDALAELLKYVRENNRDVLDRVVLLKSRLKELNENMNKGLMTNDSASIEDLKIKDSMLKVLRELETGMPYKTALESSRPVEAAPRPVEPPRRAVERAAPQDKKKPLYWALAGAGGLIVLLIIISMFSGGDDTTATDTMPEAVQSDMTGMPVDNSIPANDASNQVASGDENAAASYQDSDIVGEYEGVAHDPASNENMNFVLGASSVQNKFVSGYFVSDGERVNIKGSVLENSNQGIYVEFKPTEESGEILFQLWFYPEEGVWSLNGTVQVGSDRVELTGKRNH
jgi:hypothetical protein